MLHSNLALAVLRATLGAASAHAGSEARVGSYVDQKLVSHNGAGPDGAADFKRLLGNLRNHVEAVGRDRVEIRVVSLGDGVALFLATVKDKELAGRIDALTASGVRFLVCATSSARTEDRPRDAPRRRRAGTPARDGGRRCPSLSRATGRRRAARRIDDITWPASARRWGAPVRHRNPSTRPEPVIGWLLP